jgi:hypothetical protein
MSHRIANFTTNLLVPLLFTIRYFLRSLSDFLTILRYTQFLRYLNLLRIPWQYLPHLHSRIIPEGDPEQQGVIEWLKTQDSFFTLYI